MSSFPINRLTDFPKASATLSVLRPVATTLWPAARAALAISTPMPRPAPVMSQTLLVAMLFFLSNAIPQFIVHLSDAKEEARVSRPALPVADKTTILRNIHYHIRL